MDQKMYRKEKYFVWIIGILCCFFFAMCFQRSSFISVLAQEKEEETEEYLEEGNIELETKDGKTGKEKTTEESTTAIRDYWSEEEESTTVQKEEAGTENAVQTGNTAKKETTTKKETITKTSACSCKKVKQVCGNSGLKKTEGEIPEGKLPESVAKVTEHMKTDADGNQKTGTVDAANLERGKEFYTIQTADETRFYLIIDRNGSNELVYFLTEIKEKDLFHITADPNGTLLEESTSFEAAIPEGNGLKKEEGKTQTEIEASELELRKEDTLEGSDWKEETEKEKEKEKTESRSWIGTLVFFGVAVVLIGGIGYFLKVYQRKGEDFEEEEEEENEEEDGEEKEREEEEEEIEEREETIREAMESDRRGERKEFEEKTEEDFLDDWEEEE